jgi:hypothetical protein
MVRRRLVRALVVLAAIAVAWALVVMWMGGGAWVVAGVRISSRRPRNTVFLALLSLLIAWAFATPGQRLRDLAGEYQWLVDWIASRVPRIQLRPPGLARLVAGVAAVGIVVAGLMECAGTVGGSDSYGYVSQAHLWAIGALKQEPVLLRPLAPHVTVDVLAPLGYRPTRDGTTMAPTYSPGLPIVMAVFERFAGRDSVFWVVPLLAGALVWATYLLGARLYAPVVGALAAVLIATATPVLIQLTTGPMSDLPAAAWWTLAFVLASMDRRLAAVGSGVAAAMAILTRPNLVPVLAIAVAFLAGRLIVAKRPIRDVVIHVFLFSLFASPACFAVAALYSALWGSAVQSGYGSVGQLFSVSNVVPHLVVYPRAIARLMPVALLAPIAWFVSRDRFPTLALVSWAAVVVLVYLPFPAYDAEFSLRFLIPAIPPLIVLVSLAAYSRAGQLAARHRVAAVLVIAAVAGSGVHTARRLRAFDLEHERRYAAIGHYIARELPERAVLLAMLHSGSANYYSGRPTIRYDLLAATRLDPLVEILRQHGYVPYLLLDSDERAAFQTQYRGHSRLGALDWQPLVRMYSPPVEIYSVPAAGARRP